MVWKKIINDAVELTKNIPLTDETVPETSDEMVWPNVSTTLEEDAELICEYEVVVENSLYKFNKKVNDMIKKDWTTCWWVSVVQTNTWIKFYQAMERWVSIINVGVDRISADEVGLNIPWLEDEPDLYEDVVESS